MILVGSFLLCSLAFAAKADGMIIRAVDSTGTIDPISGYIEFTPTSFSDTHFVAGFQGELAFTVPETRIWWWVKVVIIVVRVVKIIVDTPEPAYCVLPTLDYMTEGTHSGTCDIVGTCGQFHSTYNRTPDSIIIIYGIDFPDPLPEVSGISYASGLILKVSDSLCHETGIIIEGIEPSGTCNSTVIMNIGSPLISEYEGPERTMVWDTVVITSDTTASFSGTTVTYVGTTAVIPTLTEWGLIILGVLLLGWMAWMIVRRRRRVTIGI
jgi:hypothetical protein